VTEINPTSTAWLAERTRTFCSDEKERLTALRDRSGRVSVFSYTVQLYRYIAVVSLYN